NAAVTSTIHVRPMAGLIASAANPSVSHRNVRTTARIVSPTQPRANHVREYGASGVSRDSTVVAAELCVFGRFESHDVAREEHASSLPGHAHPIDDPDVATRQYRTETRHRAARYAPASPHPIVLAARHPLHCVEN